MEPLTMRALYPEGRKWLIRKPFGPENIVIAETREDALNRSIAKFLKDSGLTGLTVGEVANLSWEGWSAHEIFIDPTRKAEPFDGYYFIDNNDCTIDSGGNLHIEMVGFNRGGYSGSYSVKIPRSRFSEFIKSLEQGQVHLDD